MLDRTRLSIGEPGTSTRTDFHDFRKSIQEISGEVFKQMDTAIPGNPLEINAKAAGLVGKQRPVGGRKSSEAANSGLNRVFAR